MCGTGVNYIHLLFLDRVLIYLITYFTRAGFSKSHHIFMVQCRLILKSPEFPHLMLYAFRHIGNR